MQALNFEVLEIDKGKSFRLCAGKCSLYKLKRKKNPTNQSHSIAKHSFRQSYILTNTNPCTNIAFVQTMTKHFKWNVIKEE